HRIGRDQRGYAGRSSTGKYGSEEMTISIKALRAILPRLVGGATLVALGCQESTTHKDVANARKNLEDARQETKQTIQEGQNDVAETQRDAQQHTAAKPVTPDDNAEARHDVAEARH